MPTPGKRWGASGAWATIVFLLCANGVGASTARTEAGVAGPEVRGIWVTRWDYRTEVDVRRAVRWCAALGFDRVFFQVRGQADAFYRSTLEPWAENFGANGPGFDPLQVALEEARTQGVELHAWVNVLPATKGMRRPNSPDHVVNRHPDWFLVDLQGKRHLNAAAGHYAILNPCLPEVRHYLARVISDIAQRYPVDGIHLDYVRFVSRGNGSGGDVPYDPKTLALFRAYSGSSPFDSPAEWDQWRRLAVNTLLHGISNAVRTARPGCVVSVAAIRDYERARTGLFQDVAAWSKNGWIDEIHPMTYVRGTRAFESATRLTQDIPGGTARIYPGIGAHLFKTPHELTAQLRSARALGTGGFTIFAFSSFFPSPSHESSRSPAERRQRDAFRRALTEHFGPEDHARRAGAITRTLPTSGSASQATLSGSSLQPAPTSVSPTSAERGLTGLPVVAQPPHHSTGSSPAREPLQPIREVPECPGCRSAAQREVKGKRPVVGPRPQRIRRATKARRVPHNHGTHP